MGHSEYCDDRYCNGCNDSDFDGDVELECECGAEPMVSECGEGRSDSYVTCPECEEEIYISGDYGDHAVRRAESGYAQ